MDVKWNSIHRSTRKNMMRGYSPPGAAKVVEREKNRSETFHFKQMTSSNFSDRRMELWNHGWNHGWTVSIWCNLFVLFCFNQRSPHRSVAGLRMEAMAIPYCISVTGLVRVPGIPSPEFLKLSMCIREPHFLSTSYRFTSESACCFVSTSKS